MEDTPEVSVFVYAQDGTPTGITSLEITDSTEPGRALLTAASVTEQRTDLGLGTAALANTGDFAATSHTHSIANVTGLQTALDGKAALVHSHIIADTTGLQTALDGKAASSHTHIIANVTGLQTALDGKANLSGGNTFSGNQTINGFARFGSYGGTFQGVTIANNAGSPTAPAVVFIDFQNENSISVADIFANLNIDGSSVLSFGTTPPGSRSTDRRAGRMLLNGSGALGFSGTNYGTPGQVLVSNGSGGTPTWGSHINLGTAVNTTSGTAIDFTGLPAGIKRLTLSFSQLSTSGTSSVVLRIGSGSFLATGYLGGGGGFDDTTGQYAFTSTDGFALGSPGAANVRDGTVHIVRTSSTLWSASGVIYSNNQQMISVAGSISFSGDITGVRLTTSGGANTFDNGTANILWEF